MKNIFLILLMFLLLAGCKSKQGCMDAAAVNYDASVQQDDGSCKYKGVITFWKLASSTFSGINVVINGMTSTVNSNFSTTPACGDSGCAVFSLQEGTYAFTADEISGLHNHWTGTVIVTAKGCTYYEFH